MMDNNKKLKARSGICIKSYKLYRENHAVEPKLESFCQY